MFGNTREHGNLMVISRLLQDLLRSLRSEGEHVVGDVTLATSSLSLDLIQLLVQLLQRSLTDYAGGLHVL